jgi:hypothetical protein
MPLNKTPININFAQGLDTKTDPYQVPPGKFLNLENTVFTKAGLLQKRNGFQSLAALPNTSSTYLTTFNGNLTAVGTNINAYSSSADTWIAKGNIQPMALSVLPLIRNSVNQSQCDSTISQGLVCTVYSEVNAGTTVYKYAIADVNTGQNIVAPKVIPVSSGTVTGSPRVFTLVNYFILVFTNVITGTSHIQYIAIPINNPSNPTTNQDIATSYISATTLSWDGVVANNNLFITYNTTAGGQAIKMTYLTVQLAAAGLTAVTPVSWSTYIATMVSMCVDTTVPQNPIIYASWYNLGTTVGYTVAVDKNMNIIPAFATPVQTIASGTVLNLTSVAINGVCELIYEISNNYSYDAGIPTHYINSVTCTVAGSVGSPYTVIRSLGLASKAFLMNGSTYFLGAYQSPYQPSYFLVNATSSLASSPVIVSKLAYSNGGGYLTVGLPSVTVVGEQAYISYLYKDLITAVNKNTNVAAGNQTAGIYAQLGINLASFVFNSPIDSSEIGQNLLLGGGFIWSYDGYEPVEQGFFLWPDSLKCVWSATGGSIVAQPDGVTNTNAYFYIATYEWADNQGNIYRSAPSIPVAVTTTSNGTSGSITVNVPYLRLTYKTANPVKIVIYRWSVGQQSYYQVTSITSATLNSTTSDSVAFVDTLADASILGNNLLYTTGGVVENISPPASNLMTLFDTRLWLVDAEDPNLLWFSKEVIEATPVEMSDLFTRYLPPTTGAQGSTGPITAISTMDDKLIIFKRDAIYYNNGNGPDNTGANNQYSQGIFITSTVGCSNQNSIVMMPQGLMFQSDKGIWLLDRGLGTTYIGAPVENYNSSTVLSAVNIPGTNQIRFILDSNITLMYDYFFGQWGTFTGIPAISSCTFQNLHTFVNEYGVVYQETPGLYLDGSLPVLINFTTSWLNLAGLQGYERIYDFYFLGTFISPHNLVVSVAYDYSPSPSQVTIIQPNNYTGNYGSDVLYGQTSLYGGPGTLEQWRVHTQKQLCQSFQISLKEQFNSSFSTTPGAGFTLSGIACRIGVKKGTRPIKAINSVG